MEPRIQRLPAGLPQSPSSGNFEKFCSDCGVMFESSTSLQVHLAYHKENLASRWVPNKPSQTSTTQSQTQSQSVSTSAPIKMDSKSELPAPTSSPHYISHAQQFTQNFPHFGQSIHFLSPQQNQFPTFDEGRTGPRLVKDRTSLDQPAEILDLDSNRVHLYNIQQEQSFYRPYLMGMAQPPPPLPAVVNGWPQGPPDAHYASHPYSQEIYSRNSAPTPPNPPYNSYALEANYAPPPSLPEPIPSTFQSQPPPQRQQREISSPAPKPMTPVGKKDNKTGEGGICPEMMRGKGKGGACKRPKAYECTSCNKWFTSSGHLKRHYGTTLHKNSAQQNGTEGMEPAIGPGRGKGKKSKKIKVEELSNPISGATTEPNSPRPLSTPDIPKTGSNGLSNELPSQTVQYAPPLLQHQPPKSTYLYIGDSQLLPPQHHAQFVSHFEGASNMYNSHSLQLPAIYNSVGYPIMEVPVPPFGAAPTPQYSTQVTTYQGHNGNGGTDRRENNSLEPGAVIKKEGTDSEGNDSPEAVRGASPRSATSWFSPDETSQGHSSTSSPSSGNDSADLLTELHPSTLENIAVEGKEEQKQLIQCPNCTKTFTRTCYLTQHKNSSHSSEGRPFKCPLCGKKFSLEPALSQHVSKHGGDKPYKCSLCPKDFNHKTDLRRHLCHHTGRMPFTCSDCGKGFIRKDHMKKHSEIHRKGSNGSGLPVVSGVSHPGTNPE